VLFWGVLILVLGVGCQKRVDTGKPRVVCSLFPLYEFAKAAGGDKADVSLLLPPGVEPHAWEPKARDLVAISQADLFLCASKDLEPWASDVVKGASREGLQVMVAADGYEKPDRPAKLDPHVWLDLAFDQVIVTGIARALSLIDPGNSNLYRANATAYGRKLEAMDHAYRSALASCRHRTLVVGGHSAFSYLAHRYGLEQIPLYGISADAEPTPQKLAEVVEIAKQRKVKFIFLETLVSPKLGRVLAEEVGAVTLALNPGANLAQEEVAGGMTFLEIMEGNLKNLKKGLECDG
jgi:zinc transport system substrate-binding protein